MVFCKNFVVGNADSQGSSAVQFHDTKCCYAFHHPTEKKISMEMWYRDMANVDIDETKGTFRFKITKPLGMIRICFVSVALSEVRSFVLKP
eukprot:913990-Rhodomonas_salina.3